MSTGHKRSGSQANGAGVRTPGLPSAYGSLGISSCGINTQATG